MLLIDSESTLLDHHVMRSALARVGLLVVLLDDLSKEAVRIVPHPIEMADIPKMRERFDAGEHWRRSGKRRGQRFK